MAGPSAPLCHPAGELLTETDHRTGRPDAAYSDAAIEMEIIHLEEGGLAVARAAAGVAEISVALLPVQVGDTVLVRAGEAIAVT